MFRRLLLASLLLAASCGGRGSPALGGDDASSPCGGDADACETLRLINEQRAAQSPALAPYVWSQALHDAAHGHDAWMTSHDCFMHECPGEPSLPERFAAVGMSAGAETIAAGYATPADVVDGWMNSPGHRAILLGDFSTVGIDRMECAACSYGVYWTADFSW